MRKLSYRPAIGISVLAFAIAVASLVPSALMLASANSSTMAEAPPEVVTSVTLVATYDPATNIWTTPMGDRIAHKEDRLPSAKQVIRYYYTMLAFN